MIKNLHRFGLWLGLLHALLTSACWPGTQLLAQTSSNQATITSFTPVNGSEFSTVTITGTYFTGATAVLFNGVAAYSFTVVSATQIQAMAPSNVSAGPISVTTPAGTATSAGFFFPRADITDYAPRREYVGASVRILGRNMVSVSKVTFNGVPATFSSVSATELQAVVPAAATTGRVQVTTPAGTTTSPFAFTVLTTLFANSLTPAPNTNRASVAGPVAVQLSAPVTAASASALRVFGSRSRGLRTGMLSGGGTAGLSFSPNANFMPGEQVSVSLPSSITSVDGVAFTPRVDQFTTAVGGSGRGTLVTGQVLDVGGGEPRVVGGDLDQDGDADLILVGSYVTPLVYLNDGKGNYAAPYFLNAGYGAIDLALGDLDGDGDLDVVASNGFDFLYSYIRVCFNDGKGNFTFGSFANAETRSSRVVLGDIDADGDLDLLSNFIDNSSYNSRTITVRLNDGTGKFTGTTQLDSSLSICLVLGDIDGDHDLDLLTVRKTIGSSGQADIWENDGTGTFIKTFRWIGLGVEPVAVALGDIDNDGDLDLVSTNHGSSYYGSESSVSVCLNNGSGVFARTPDTPLGGVLRDIALGDLDADGDLDVVVSNENFLSPGEVIIRLNDGQGRFSTLGTKTAGFSPASLALLDTDGDADLDVVTGCAFQRLADMKVQILLNQPQTVTATGLAQPAEPLSLYPNPASGEFSLQLPASFNGHAVQLTIRNSLGQLVYTAASLSASKTTALTVKLPGLAPGMYDVRVMSNNQQLSQRLLLK